MAIVVSEERGQIALAMNGRIDRGLTPDELRERLAHVRRAAARQRALDVRVRRLMAYHPFRHLGLKVVALALREPAVADRRRRARRRAHPARAARVPEHSVAARGRRRSARTASTSGCAARRRCSAAWSRRRRGGARPQQARPGSRLFHIRNEEVRSPFGVRGRAGHARHARHRAREVGDAAWCRWWRRSMASRRRASSVGPVTAEPATVEIAGPESRVKKLANATTEPVTVAGARDNVRDVVAVGSARFRGAAGQAAERHGDRRRPAGAGRARAARACRCGRAISAAGWRRRRSRPASVTVSVRGRREALAERPRRDHRRVRRPCRPRSRPVQSSGPGRSFPALRGQRDHSRRGRRHHQGDQVVVSIAKTARHANMRMPTHDCPDAIRWCRMLAIRPILAMTSMSHRLFGTDGVRGKAGEYPLDHETVARLGGGAGARDARRAAGQLRFIVGRDTRESGEWIERELARGVRSEGAHITTAGVMPDAGGRLRHPRDGLRRRPRHLRVAQSVSGQRHQGVLGPRREVHRSARAAGRSDRRRRELERSAAPRTCRSNGPT